MITQEFDWGEANDWFKKVIGEEIFVNQIYEKVVKINDGDLVVDLGASVGPFGYSLRNRKLKHLYCIEPSPQQFITLELNSKKLPFPTTCINKGIGGTTGTCEMELWGTYKDQGIQQFEIGHAPSISFKDFIKTYSIETIDFLKTDCEGGEYDVFNIENFSWIHANVRKIVGEWHLQTPEMILKFVKFRDLYLRSFDNFEIRSVDGFNITDSLYTDWFVGYFKQIIIHIDNSKNVKKEYGTIGTTSTN